MKKLLLTLAFAGFCFATLNAQNTAPAPAPAKMEQKVKPAAKSTEAKPAAKSTEVKPAAKSHEATSVKAAPASKPASSGTMMKKDGTPDKRYSANKKMKKDGTPDKRYSSNKDKKAVPADTKK